MDTLTQKITNRIGSDFVQPFLDFASSTAGTRCLEIDEYAYVLVAVDAETRTTPVSIKDDAGRVLCEETFAGG